MFLVTTPPLMEDQHMDALDLSRERFDSSVYWSLLVLSFLPIEKWG